MDWILIPRFLNGLLMIVMPVLLGFFLWKRYPGRAGADDGTTGATWRIWWIGVAAMVLAQVGHFPFNWLLTALFKNGVLPSPPQAWTLVFNAVVLGLSAGVWEEGFRYIAYRWMAKDARSWGAGLMLGAGHGGIEAILLGLYVLYILFQMVALKGANLAQMVPAQQLAAIQAQVSAFWSTPWYLTIMGAVERVFALIFHLTASVMVLQVFLRRQIRWLWLAIIWHALLDAIAVFASARNIATVEISLGLFALVTLGILYYLRQITPVPSPEVDQPGPSQPDPLPGFQPSLAPETPDELDRSRFQ